MTTTLQTNEDSEIVKALQKKYAPTTLVCISFCPGLRLLEHWNQTEVCDCLKFISQAKKRKTKKKNQRNKETIL